MDAIFTATIAVLAIVALAALLWANQKREKENYMTEGMCLGIILGAGFRGLLDMDLSIAISVGMLLGALIGQQVSKEKKQNSGGEEAPKEDHHENH